MSSTQLISGANNFLDKLSISVENKELVKKLRKNIAILNDYREQMLFYGFDTPFLALLAQTKAELEDVSQAEIKDLVKQLQKIRDVANSKKFSLNRVRVSLQAHKIALAHFKENSRKEIIQHLPLDGNYIKRLSQLDEHGLFAYKHANDFLSSKGNESEKTILVTIRYRRDERQVVERVKLFANTNIESRLKRVYGENVEILGTKIYSVQTPLMKRSARVCLATAYSILADSYANEHVDKKLGVLSKGLKEYYRIMQKHGLKKDAKIDMYEEFDRVKEELFKKGLMVLIDDEYVLSPEVAEPLLEKKRLLRSISLRRVEFMLGNDIFEYFLLKPKREREASLLFPSLNAVPQIEQLGFLNGAVSEEYTVGNLTGLLKKKFELENMKLNIKGKALGVALFYLISNRDLNFCASEFNCPKSEIEKAARKIALFVESRKEKLAALGVSAAKTKTKKFLELIKNVGDKRSKRRDS